MPFDGGIPALMASANKKKMEKEFLCQMLMLQAHKTAVSTTEREIKGDVAK